MREIGAAYPVSELADPPIGIRDTQHVETTICRVHQGRIAHSPTDQDHHGKVMWCPIGRMYWRYTARLNGMHAPLTFPRGL